MDCPSNKFSFKSFKEEKSQDWWKIIMHIPVLIFQWLVTIADAIIYGVVTFFGLIFFMLIIGFADGDDYWAEGGMLLPGESKIESTD